MAGASMIALRAIARGFAFGMAMFAGVTFGWKAVELIGLWMRCK